MKKTSENAVCVETIVRELGGSGLQKGFWLLIESALLRMDGQTVRQAVCRVAEEHKIPPKLVRRRIGGVCARMEKEQTGAYLALWGEGKRPSPYALIEEIAAMADVV